MEKIIANKESPPLGVLAAVELVGEFYPLGVDFVANAPNALVIDGQTHPLPSSDLLRAIARYAIKKQLYGSSALHKTQVDAWLTFSQQIAGNPADSVDALQQFLASSTFLVAHRLTIADLAVFEVLRALPVERPAHVQRWFQLVAGQEAVARALASDTSKPRPAAAPVAAKTPSVAAPAKATKTAAPAAQPDAPAKKPKADKPAKPAKNEQIAAKAAGDRKQEGTFIDLPGAKMGEVVVRFPPEASGYLHIGHAKAALLNQYYQQAYNGTLIMRFDDTNPAKETVEFEQVILEDLKLLEIVPDRFTHTSDYFDLMLGYCEQLLREGKAYADDTSAEQMKAERDERKESANRSNTVERNFALWAEMRAGSEAGKRCCIRAKIDMQSLNGCLRDPTIYRCKDEPHPKTGTKYKVYPTYDFACPIVDAIENVTNTLRTTEYLDRDDQFYWFIDALNLRRPSIWAYSRLNMTNTVLSKRKLTWFVNNGLVDGWDDPRFPTVRGILRRGMTVKGLKEFIIAQGSSKSVVFMEWDKIWTFNKKVIDPIAPRFTALLRTDPVRVLVNGQADYVSQTKPKHPKNADVGTKEQFIGPELLIDGADAQELQVGAFATFINWGNMLVQAVERDPATGHISVVRVDVRPDNTDFRNTLKLTWLCNPRQVGATPLVCVYFEHIISKAVLAKNEDFQDFIGKDTRQEIQMWGEPEMARLKEGDIIQLTRRGFFRVDQAFAPASEYTGVVQPVVLFAIPDGHSKAQPTSGQPATVAKKAPATEPEAKTASSSAADQLNAKVAQQGDLVRDLKAKKALKPEVEAAVKSLLALKADFKQATGQDWKPGCVPAVAAAPAVVAAAPVAASPATALNDNIVKQGDLVRDLKAKKAPKPEVEAAVKSLLALKADFKQATGQDWKPGCVAAAPAVAPVVAVAAAPVGGAAAEINAKITVQGDLVRDLKAKKAAKPEVEAAVKSLLALKADFKQATGQDWKPGCVPAVAAVAADPVATSAGADLNAKITAQGDLVRDLKAKKAAKPEVEAAVKSLLALKADFKQATGQDWKPAAVVAAPVAAVAPVAVVAPAAGVGSDINAKIVAQGDLVRDLKAKKAAKPDIEAAVKSLLALKADYKQATGQDWKPGCVPMATPAPAAAPAPAATSVAAPASGAAADINAKITQQGDLVRDLKAKKAAKPEIDAAVKSLLALKADYKQATGQDWKPGCVSASATAVAPVQVAAPAGGAAADINAKITQQGDLVRDLKAKKAAKPEIDAAVKSLLALKADYKQATGQDWKPGCVPASAAAVAPVQVAAPASGAGADINAKITQQGDLVRDLKAKKAAKPEIDAAVKTLLALKADYKQATGQDWKPGCVAPSAAVAAPVVVAAVAAPVEDAANAALVERIGAQSEAVRALKSSGAAADAVKAAVDGLLALKAEYKQKTGRDFPAGGRTPSAAKPKAKPVAKVVAAPAAGQTRLGLEATKADNLPEWYSQVITKSEMIEYYDVSGCYILRPWSIMIWRTIQNFFQDEITKLGVKECYFPMFVSKAALEKEKEHIADFSPEVAWVTRSGDSDLAEPIAIRPTSETIMYPAFAKWIQSHRDLPLKLNQWSNVVRWEFKHPQPFLRTREFLWQEGHTAFADLPQAEAEVLDILHLYARIYEELLAIPVRRGRKSEKEKFAGGDYTTTVEAFVSASGRSIQGATSHHLGQNFSKMFDIIFEDPLTQEKKYVYQNSWGITTRTIGVMVMVHGDDKGLVIPPRVAPTQAVIVPCGITVNSSAEERAALQASCEQLERTLRAAGVRVEGDYRDNYSPGWKYNHWELKGTPVRVELGPKDMRNEQLVLVRRDTGEKLFVKRADAGRVLGETLQAIQANLFARAQKDFDEHLVQTRQWAEFTASLERKNVLLAPFCGGKDCEDTIKEDSANTEATEPGAMVTGAKSLCIPFEQPGPIEASDKCINPKCSAAPKHWCYFGRSY